MDETPEATFKRNGGRIQIEMSVKQWERILVCIGIAASSFIRLANELNQHNPQYTPYEIPQEYAAD